MQRINKQAANDNENLPAGWKKVKLGEVLAESKERNNKNNYDVVFTISNKQGFAVQEEFFGRKLSSKDTSNYKIVQPGYFAYNPARINVGSIALNENSTIGIISPMYVVFKAKESLLPEYFKYHTQRKLFNNQVIMNTAGTVRESLNYSALETFTFLLPPLPEQERIASVLSQVDAVIEKETAYRDKLSRIKQGLMEDLLTGKVRVTALLENENNQYQKEAL